MFTLTGIFFLHCKSKLIADSFTLLVQYCYYCDSRPACYCSLFVLSPPSHVVKLTPILQESYMNPQKMSVSTTLSPLIIEKTKQKTTQWRNMQGCSLFKKPRAVETKGNLYLLVLRLGRLRRRVHFCKCTETRPKGGSMLNVRYADGRSGR